MGRQYRLGRRMSYFTPSSVVGARWQEPPPPQPHGLGVPLIQARLRGAKEMLVRRDNCGKLSSLMRPASPGDAKHRFVLL